MLGDVVLGVSKKKFEEILRKKKEQKKLVQDHELSEDALQELISDYKQLIKKETGKEFPQDVKEQLLMSISAVFESWNNPRAVTYRQLNHIPDDLGTAVNVQQMVFGNIGEDSATGVGFTRDPATGEKELYGEYLFNAQGEDVVAGIRTPNPLNEATSNDQNRHLPSLEKAMPDTYKALHDIRDKLEDHFRDMQDIEFTIENSKLYMLQTRTGKRTGAAAVKIACDMVKEKLIDEKTAIKRIPANDLTQLLLPSFDPKAKAKASVLTVGLPASPGASFGKLAFTAEEAVERTHAGERVLLVRQETSPEDVDGMHNVDGILTSTGGMTSHAAVVAREMGIPAVVGAEGASQTLASGQRLRVDGRAGTVEVID